MKTILIRQGFAFAPIRGTGILLSFLILASGCSTYWPMSGDLEEAIRSKATLSPSIEDHQAVEKVGREASEGTIAFPEAFSIPEKANLNDYIRIALERNPKIQASIRDLEALGLQIPQVTSLEDPILTFVPPTGDMVQTAAGMMDGSIGISQKLPFPWKLKAIGKVAERVVRMALENLQAIRLAVAAEVKKAYYRYYLSVVSIRVTRENQVFLERLRSSADARYRAGTASQQEVLRAEVELHNLSNDLFTLEQERRTAMAHFNLLMDRDVQAEIPPPPPFDPAHLEWKLSELMGRSVEKSPALKAIQERIRRNLEAVHLAKLQYAPDLIVGGGYTWISSAGVSPVASGDDAWNLNFGIKLPIWLHRIRAGILQRNAEVLGSSLHYRNIRNDLFFSLQDLTVRVDTDYRSAILLRDAIIPRARQTVEISEREYQAGKLDFLTLIDNWRTLLEFHLQYHMSLASLEQNFAELERLAGGELPRKAPEKAVGPRLETGNKRHETSQE